MIETERQRRWWFATHPEYHSDRKGGGRRNSHERDEDSDKVPPESHAELRPEWPGEATVASDQPRRYGIKDYFSYRLGYNAGRRHLWSGKPLPPRNFKDKSPYTQGFQQGVEDAFREIKNEAEWWDYFLKTWDTLIDYIPFMGGSQRRLPPKGTRERARIEAARNKGIELRQRQELADIQAGGKGSGVWSKKELESIRRTGKWPDDAVWHHDPTVANRPDLAADPRSVHLMRGGRRTHFERGHKRNWRYPYE